MPEMDGIAVAEALRESGVDGSRIVLLTPVASTRMAELLARGAIGGHLAKPVLERDLAALLRRMAPGREEARGAGEPVQAAQPDRSTVAGMRVLVVDDNPVNRMLASRMLAKMAQNGREAFEKWQQGSYDAILMDVQMPGMDGFEATHLIRDAESLAGPVLPGTPIVAMTAHAMVDDRDRCLSAGMDGYVAKPVSLAALAEALAQAGRLGRQPHQPPRK